MKMLVYIILSPNLDTLNPTKHQQLTAGEADEPSGQHRQHV